MQKAAQAAELASHYDKLIDRQSEIYRQLYPSIVPGYVKAHVGAAMNKGTKIPSEVLVELRRLIIGQQFYHLQFMAQDVATVALWRLYKIVYHFDPDVWEELGDMDEDYVVPAGLFRHLPHPDPFIAFPEPMWVLSDVKTLQRVDGFFVTGRIFDEQSSFQRSTTHPQVDALGLLFCGPLFHESDRTPVMLDDGQQDAIFTRTVLSLNGDSIRNVIDLAGKRFLDLEDSSLWKKNVPRMIKRAVAMMIYLCAKNADLRPLPAPPPRARGGGRDKKHKPVKVVEVGYRLGAALRAYRKRQATEDAGAGTGRTMKPHVRRAHPHTYWYGPGRTKFYVKWLPSIPVNFDGSSADRPTVIGVPK